MNRQVSTPPHDNSGLDAVPLATAVVYVRRCCSRTFDVRAQTFDRDQRLTVTPSNISKLPETELASDQSSIRAVSTTVRTDQISDLFTRLLPSHDCKEYLTVMGARHRYELISIYSSTTVRTGSLTYLLAHGCNEYLTVMDAAIFPLPP
jgi:hypothetical protein